MPDQRQRDLTMRFLAEPTDVNFGGKVHGGAVMKWIDQAAYAAAVGWCGTYAIRFMAPVHIGDLVAVHAQLVRTGTTSMHFSVDVTAGSPMDAGAPRRLCTHCMIVFVAMDEASGSPVTVPAWTPASEADRRLADYAGKVMELGKGIEETIARALAQ